MELKLVCTCQVSPVQYEGTINGRPLYFRARWSNWSFTVANTFEEAVLPGKATKGSLFIRVGTYGAPDEWAAGCMPLSDAEQIIKQCIQEYLAERGED